MRDLSPSFKENTLTENDTNVIKFEDKKLALQTGGNEPTNENWLEGLKVGTAFLSRDKISPAMPVQQRNEALSNPFLNECHVVYKTDVSTLLMIKLPDGNSITPHVDTLRFSRQKDLVVILGVVQDDTEEQQTSERTDALEDQHAGGDPVEPAGSGSTKAKGRASKAETAKDQEA